MLRKVEGILPDPIRRKLLQGPSRQIRFLRLVVQAIMVVVPRGVWFTSHIRSVWTTYHRRNVRGARLADEHLSGTSLVPERVEFPPTRVNITGWPGWLLVCEAEERAETTLHEKLIEMADEGRFEDVESWLDRFLRLRRSGWERGLFSVDAHLKNFGVSGDRIFLLDTGGLTNRWTEIEDRLAYEEGVPRPHVRLGLEGALASRPDIADRFDELWKATVNRSVVEYHWPE